VDAFGTLLTHLPAEFLPRLVAAGRLLVGDREITRVVGTYGEAPPGTTVALVGSQGVIEAAVVQGRADMRLSATIGTRVQLP
jgi:S-adenosylmethionine hydrolase